MRSGFERGLTPEQMYKEAGFEDYKERAQNHQRILQELLIEAKKAGETIQAARTKINSKFSPLVRENKEWIKNNIDGIELNEEDFFINYPLPEKYENLPFNDLLELPKKELKKCLIELAHSLAAENEEINKEIKEEKRKVKKRPNRREALIQLYTEKGDLSRLQCMSLAKKLGYNEESMADYYTRKYEAIKNAALKLK